jgi:hypothetical protein
MKTKTGQVICKGEFPGIVLCDEVFWEVMEGEEDDAENDGGNGSKVQDASSSPEDQVASNDRKKLLTVTVGKYRKMEKWASFFKGHPEIDTKQIKWITQLEFQKQLMKGPENRPDISTDDWISSISHGLGEGVMGS